jgi:hypothetical protein
LLLESATRSWRQTESQARADGQDEVEEGIHCSRLYASSPKMARRVSISLALSGMIAAHIALSGA